MAYDPERHHRRSIRLADYDYRQNGAYYVTVCTHERECLFGEIDAEGAMRLNEWGEIVQEEWERTEIVRANVSLDAFVVMPNHVHGILVIMGVDGPGARAQEGDPPGRPYTSSTRGEYQHPTGPMAGSLGALLGQFKSITSKRINALRATPGWTIWQRNYFERIIPDEHKLNNARRYIENNLARWAEDVNNPANVTKM